MSLDQAVVSMASACVNTVRLIRPFSRPISGLSGRMAPMGPGGTRRRIASIGGIADGRVAAGLAIRFGGGKG